MDGWENIIGSVVAGAFSAGSIGAILSYIRGRRKDDILTPIAAEAGSVAYIQNQVSVLQEIIESQRKRIEDLEGDLIDERRQRKAEVERLRDDVKFRNVRIGELEADIERLRKET